MHKLKILQISKIRIIKTQQYFKIKNAKKYIDRNGIIHTILFKSFY
jgi:hypothetical protein